MHVNSQERQPQQAQVNPQIKDMLLSLLLLYVLASPGMSSQSVGGFNPAFNLICKLCASELWPMIRLLLMTTRIQGSDL